MLRITVVIVTYNAADFIVRCLHSLVSSEQKGLIKVVVVDNASEDETVDIVRNNFPWVKLIQSGWNRGFGAGNNLAIDDLEGDFVFILNPDAEIEEYCCETLIDFLDSHPDTGCVGPAVVDESGERTVSFQAFTSLLTSFWSASCLHKFIPLNRINGRWKVLYKPPPVSVEVDRLLGAAMMVRRSALQQTGGFDENFFLFSEEEDLCYRLRQLGWLIYYSPVASVKHRGSGCTQHRHSLSIAAINWSRYYYLRKHNTHAKAELSRIIWIIAIFLRLIVNFFNFSAMGRSQRRGYILSLRSLIKPDYFDNVIRPRPTSS